MITTTTNGDDEITLTIVETEIVVAADPIVTTSGITPPTQEIAYTGTHSNIITPGEDHFVTLSIADDFVANTFSAEVPFTTVLSGLGATRTDSFGGETADQITIGLVAGSLRSSTARYEIPTASRVTKDAADESNYDYALRVFAAIDGVTLNKTTPGSEGLPSTVVFNWDLGTLTATITGVITDSFFTEDAWFPGILFTSVNQTISGSASGNVDSTNYEVSSSNPGAAGVPVTTFALDIDADAQQWPGAMVPSDGSYWWNSTDDQVPAADGSLPDFNVSAGFYGINSIGGIVVFWGSDVGRAELGKPLSEYAGEPIYGGFGVYYIDIDSPISLSNGSTGYPIRLVETSSISGNLPDAATATQALEHIGQQSLANADWTGITVGDVFDDTVVIPGTFSGITLNGRDTSGFTTTNRWDVRTGHSTSSSTSSVSYTDWSDWAGNTLRVDATSSGDDTALRSDYAQITVGFDDSTSATFNVISSEANSSDTVIYLDTIAEQSGTPPTDGLITLSDPGVNTAVKSITIDTNVQQNLHQTFTLTNTDGGFSVMEVSGASVMGSATTYNVLSYDMSEITSFTSSVPDSSTSDLDFVKQQVINAINTSTESPVDFTATEDAANSKILLTTTTEELVKTPVLVTRSNHIDGDIEFTTTITNAGSSGVSYSFNYSTTPSDVEIEVTPIEPELTVTP